MANRHTRVRTHRPSRTNPEEGQKPMPSPDEEYGPGRPHLREVPAGRRKRRTGRVWLRVTIRLAIVAAVLAGGLALWLNWDRIAPDGLAYAISGWLSGSKKGDGFPVTFTGSEAKSIAETSEGLAILTDTSYAMYNHTGGELIRRQHGFANPIMKTAGRWMLIYDQMGSKYKLANRASETDLETRAENAAILNAAVNAKGDYAIVTQSKESGFTSEVAAYINGKDPYVWYSAEMYVMAAALSPDGGAMAVVGYNTVEGQGVSTLLLFDLRKDQPVVHVTDKDMLYFDVAYMEDGRVAAIGNKGLRIVDGEGEGRLIGYEDRSRVGHAVSDGMISVVLSNYGQTSGGLVLTVGSDGREMHRTAFEGEYHHIAPGAGGMLLLTSQTLYRLDGEGVKATYDTTRDGRFVGTLQGDAVIAGLTELRLVELD